ncbi:MAG: hypothetical protein R2877_05695 [Bdellovibrionota bacterium]
MKTKNNIQKLVLVALTMIGTLTQIGCGGGFDFTSCDETPRSGTYKITIQDSEFVNDVEATGKLHEWCDDTSMLQTIYLSLKLENNNEITWDTFGSGSCN